MNGNRSELSGYGFFLMYFGMLVVFVAGMGILGPRTDHPVDLSADLEVARAEIVEVRDAELSSDLLLIDPIGRETL